MSDNNFSTCYIDKSSEKAIIIDNEGSLWHLQGLIAITEYSEEDDNYLVSYKCIVDYNIVLSKLYEAGDDPAVFAHIGDEVNVRGLFHLWSINAFPYNEAPIDYYESIKQYGLKVLNNLAQNDLSIIICKYGLYYYIYVTDGTNEFELDSRFTYVVHNNEPGDFLFAKYVSQKKEYGRCPVIEYLVHIIYALRKMLNSEDICFKDVFMRGEDKSRLPVPDIFDGFIDKINAKITELYEWDEKWRRM